MALRLRRGLDLDRVGVIFAEGELVYATDTKRLHIGDGATAGGIPVGDLLGDTSPQLGATLDLNTHSIVGLGTISIDGNISSTGGIQANTIEGNFKGTFSADDSTILIDGVNNKLVLSNNELNDFGNVNLANEQLRQFLKWSGTQWQNSYITLEDLVDVVTGGGVQVGQVLKYDGANWVPSEDTTASGNIIGDLKGSVFGDDSTVLVDSVNGFINLSRNMLSDLHDIATDQPTNNQVLAWNGVRWSPTDLGNIQLSYLTGDVKGSVFGDDSTVLVDSVNLRINLSNNSISDLNDVFVLNPAAGNILQWTGFDWEPSDPEFAFPSLTSSITGTLQGTVIADDAGILLDATTKELSANQINAPIDGLVFKPKGIGSSIIRNVGRSAPSVYTGERENTTVILANDGNANAIFTAGYTDQNGARVGAVVNYYDNMITFGNHPNGFIIGSGPFEPPAAELVTISSTAGAAPKLGVGTKTPSQELDIVGNATVAGFMQVGRYADNTARDAAITAPGEGMIVFNQATQKFQGYVTDTGLAGGGASNSTPGWVDLY